MTTSLPDLPPPAVVETLAYDAVKAEVLADFQRLAPTFDALLESDPAIKALEAGAYRELLLRWRINQAARANLLAFAAGSDLDHLAVFYGVERLQGEPDDRFRLRTRDRIIGWSTGGGAASYRYHALSAHADIEDVSVSSPEPYQIGVLLSSSNAVTWTPHQEKDLTFRLLAAEYTAATKEVVLGTHTLANASDLIALAAVDRPAANTDVEFVVVDASGNVHTLNEMQPLNLSDRISGAVTIKAVLKGGGTMSPVLYPAIKTAVGNMAVTGDYVSRGFQAAATFALSIVLDTLLPGTATVAVYAESATTGNWVAVPFEAGKAIGNGRVEQTFRKTGLTGVGGTFTTRVRVVLTGSPANRPFVYALRAVAT